LTLYPAELTGIECGKLELGNMGAGKVGGGNLDAGTGEVGILGTEGRGMMGTYGSLCSWA